MTRVVLLIAVGARLEGPAVDEIIETQSEDNLADLAALGAFLAKALDGAGVVEVGGIKGTLYAPEPLIIAVLKPLAEGMTDAEASAAFARDIGQDIVRGQMVGNVMEAAGLDYGGEEAAAPAEAD